MEIDLLILGVLFLASVVIAYYIGRLVRATEIKKHRKDAILRSRAVLGGQFSEQIAPYLPGFKHLPTECRFVGKPVDFIVFKGMDGKEIREVIFVEVKSGKSSLSPVERSLKEAIEKGRVKFEEYRVDEGVTKNVDVEDIAWRNV